MRRQRTRCLDMGDTRLSLQYENPARGVLTISWPKQQHLTSEPPPEIGRHDSVTRTLFNPRPMTLAQEAKSTTECPSSTIGDSSQIEHLETMVLPGLPQPLLTESKFPRRATMGPRSRTETRQARLTCHHHDTLKICSRWALSR